VKIATILSHKEVAGDLGYLENWLLSKRFSIRRIYREDNWDCDALLEGDLLVILGSLRSVATGYCHPGAAKEIDLIKKRLKQSLPLLAVCYGSQLLALALGGEVERMSSPIIRYDQIENITAPEAINGPWVIWHEDRIIPESLLKNDEVQILCTYKSAVEAFSTGSAWGIQFHPELDLSSLKRLAEAISVTNDVFNDLQHSMLTDSINCKTRAISLFDTFWRKRTTV